ncbi:MAG: DUF1203 domain-containing protein [Gammaproteobacteria bacterium]
MSFQIVGLPVETFSPLFSLTERELAELNVQRVVATEHPGFPCRVSLADAQIGEELLLLPYEHQPAQSPYRASGPIFVRKAARKRSLAVDEVTDYVRLRLLSVRAYDSTDRIIDATVCAGKDIAVTLLGIFDNLQVAYIHLHNANRGCFSCRVNRA